MPTSDRAGSSCGDSPVMACDECGKVQPTWPNGWRATGDGHHYCPVCKATVTQTGDVA